MQLDDSNELILTVPYAWQVLAAVHYFELKYNFNIILINLILSRFKCLQFQSIPFSLSSCTTHSRILNSSSHFFIKSASFRLLAERVWTTKIKYLYTKLYNSSELHNDEKTIIQEIPTHDWNEKIVSGNQIENVIVIKD